MVCTHSCTVTDRTHGLTPRIEGVLDAGVAALGERGFLRCCWI